MIVAYNATIMTQSSPHAIKLLRQRKRLTQAQLAAQAGVSRTCITAIETGQMIPSVTIALAIAKVLDTSVEALFNSPEGKESIRWAYTGNAEQTSHWKARFGDVVLKFPADTRPMLSLLPDDFGESVSDEETLVLATCDPSIGLLASLYAAMTGKRLIAIHRSSRDALEMLKSGTVHVAGVHWSNEQSPDDNQRIARQTLGSEFSMIRLTGWQLGVAIAPTVRVRSTSSLRRQRLRWVGRENGSAARRCQDALLDGHPEPDLLAFSHRDVAGLIRSGGADAGVCVRAVSAEAGLNFIPVQNEMLDLCCLPSMQSDQRFRALVRVVRSKSYRRLIGAIPGYTNRDTGEVICR
ncbi:MAG TPA: substrate-binding domain-containing protein [Pirellulaceae bacterium]|nr:substrate-binding domain-containing protein [Pirellulaceae bacterium]HMO91247.1 substrate-binding domain-containing protein [Pirellulaceae bacterium]HMP68569.1 substrate-binding domain-containing protein [Pirellulaceae bacterium]